MSSAMNNSITLVTGLSLATIFLSPSMYITALGLIAITVISSIAYFISTGWITSNPNEWLLIIENGNLKKAGVGLKTFKWMNQAAVKFPSTIQGVDFSANQVTKENFGIEIQGVVFWAVHRDADGPFNCYKYTQGSNANENVKQVCESIVRSCISNTSLMDVLTKRVELRNDVSKQLEAQLKGWGIWPETVEITEVKISSSTSFKDMQTEFRMKHKQKATTAKQASKKIIDEEQEKYELILSKIKRDNANQLSQFRNEQEIKIAGFKQKFEEKKVKIETEQLSQKQQLDLLQQDRLSSQTALRKEQELEINKLHYEFEARNKKEDQKLENMMNERNLEKMELDFTAKTYENMCQLSEIKINKYSGPDNFANIASALPAMGLMNQGIQKR